MVESILVVTAIWLVAALIFAMGYMCGAVKTSQRINKAIEKAVKEFRYGQHAG